MDGRTVAIPFCDECPPLRDWSEKALIRGTCERCGRGDTKAWRELQARRLREDVRRYEADLRELADS